MLLNQFIEIPTSFQSDHLLDPSTMVTSKATRSVVQRQSDVSATETSKDPSPFPRQINDLVLVISPLVPSRQDHV